MWLVAMVRNNYIEDFELFGTWELAFPMLQARGNDINAEYPKPRVLDEDELEQTNLHYTFNLDDGDTLVLQIVERR